MFLWYGRRLFLRPAFFLQTLEWQASLAIDYASLATTTGVTAEYMKKHAETRWVSMKYVTLRCLEQRKIWRSIFSNFSRNKRTLKKRLRKHKERTNQNCSEQANHGRVCVICCFCSSWLSGVSCSLSINRTYSCTLPSANWWTRYRRGNLSRR